MDVAEKESPGPRGIPKAPFIDNVEEFMKEKVPDETLKAMQDTYNKYKFMEVSLAKSKSSLKYKIPDIESTLDMVLQLKAKKAANETLDTHYELSDQIWANATVTPSVVCLWLGANVMVEYSFEEATQLLSNNLQTAKSSLEKIEEEIDFLKEQITTMEVNIARVYNYDVKQRRKKREAEAAPTTLVQ